MRSNLIALILFLFIAFHVDAQTRSLDFYVQAALQSSPVIKDYSAQITRASYDSASISATRKPQVFGIGNVMLAPTYKGFGYDEAITNGANYAAVVSVSKTILSKKTYAPQFQALNIQNAVATNASKITAHDLERSVTNQYLVAYGSFSQLSYNKSLLKLVKEEQVILEAFVKQGIYRETDYLAFDLERQMQEVQIEQILLQYKSDLGNLNSLCGIEDTGYYELNKPEILSVVVKPFSYSSPFQMQYRLDSMRIVNTRQLIQTQYNPHLSVFADGGLQASKISTAYKNFGFSFGVSYVIPLYDGRQKDFQFQKLGVDENIRFNYQQFYSSQQRIAISQLQLQIAGTKQLILKENALLKTSNMLVNANKSLLESGQAGVSDFILAIKSNLEIKQQLNEAEISLLTLTTELNYWNW